MEIALDRDRPVPTLRLAGRFDGDGATAFDAFVESLDPAAEHWILDFTNVKYLSSMGLRALVTAEKRLRARHGGLVLANVSSHVRHVLEMAHLDTVLRIADSVEAAERRVSAGSVAPHRAARSVRDGRTCAVWPLGGRSVLEWWGRPASPGAAAGQSGPERLSTLTLADLAFAVGIGGLGATREQASEAIGPIIAARAFAGLRTAGTHNPSDFVVSDRQADAVVHVESALGVDGSPALALEISCDQPLSIAELVDDVLAAGGDDDASSVTGILALVTLVDRPAPAILMLVVAADRPGDGSDVAGAFERLSPSIDGRGRWLTGRMARLSNATALPPMTADPMEAIAQVAALESLDEVSGIDPAGQVSAALAWSFRPSHVREGREKLLAVEVDHGAPIRDEWETIARHLYRDCRRVVLTPLLGGFMSSTFRVASYDGDGRRLLPTVLKIGGLALTEREEAANRKYVQTFILNNSTTLLGEAVAGEWAGLRYNFLGVNGPDSSLTWLRDHYQRRPAADVVALFRALFTRVLKPWYGQPRWEPIALYAEHDPRRLFPALLDAAEAFTGVSADSERLPCAELGRDLLNPYYFLKHEFAARSRRSRLWYTAICHGDLNMQNVLVDERDNIYVIDFSETRPRNVVSDFARLEPIVKFEQIPIASAEDVKKLLRFEQGLMRSVTLDAVANEFPGENPHVDKAFEVIRLMRWLANTATIFETDIVPYWLALLEWTLPVVVFRQCTGWQKRYAVYSAGLIAEAILAADSRTPAL